MTIIVDGASNPASVVYNGTELSQVVCDGTTVWRRFPASLSTLTVTIGNSSTVTIRNATCTGMYKDSSGWYAVYSADASLDLTWEQGALIGSKNRMWNPIYLVGGSLGTGWSCSGLASGFSFGKWNLGSFETTLMFYKTNGSSAYSLISGTLTQGTSRVLPTTFLQCTPDPDFSYYTALDYYGLYTFTAGAVLQQSITFSIWQT